MLPHLITVNTHSAVWFLFSFPFEQEECRMRSDRQIPFLALQDQICLCTSYFIFWELSYLQKVTELNYIICIPLRILYFALESSLRVCNNN